MKKLEIKVRFEDGLHARPAIGIVEIAKKSNSEITMIHKENNIRMRSIISILSASIKQGDSIFFEIVGEDEDCIYEELLLLLK